MTNPVTEYIDTSNLISPIKTTKDMVTERVFPQDFTKVNRFLYKAPKAEDIYQEELLKLEQLRQHIVGADRSNPKNTVKMAPVIGSNAPLMNFGVAHNLTN